MSWRTPEPDVYSITGTRRSAAEDQRARRNRYLWSMGVRTLCFVLAIVTTGPMRWVFIAAAILLPYVAVVFANAGRERSGAQPETPGTPPMVAIEHAAPSAETIQMPGPDRPASSTDAAGP